MPKAAVDEDGCAARREHQVGPPGDLLGVEAVTKAEPVKGLPDREFRLRITRSDPGHHPAAGFGVNDVGHELSVLGEQFLLNAHEVRRNVVCDRLHDGHHDGVPELLVCLGIRDRDLERGAAWFIEPHQAGALTRS